MRTHNLGYPRIGSKRELKKACEKYWAGKISEQELQQAAMNIRLQNLSMQQQAGLDLVPVNDFSFYDQVLDVSVAVGAIPPRYEALRHQRPLDLYFAMARGYQKDGLDITAMEMTKWFDTNYHYIVPEFYKDQSFQPNSSKILYEFKEAKQQGIRAKPVMIGPVSYLMLGKEKQPGFHRIELIENLLPAYLQLIETLINEGAEIIQMDEPFLVMDIDEDVKSAFHLVYNTIRDSFPQLHVILATYFGSLRDNLKTALALPVQTLHIDLVRAPEQLDEVLQQLPDAMQLSLGVVDGRNIWKNDFSISLNSIQKAVAKIGEERILLAPSCSLLHVPCDLELEDIESAKADPAGLSYKEINMSHTHQWLAFGKQKINEVVLLRALASNNPSDAAMKALDENKKANHNRKSSVLIHHQQVKERVQALTDHDAKRRYTFEKRKPLQQANLRLPLFPTTTIGSFPQTAEVRSWRAQYKKGTITAEEYDALLKQETEKAIRWQEQIGIDVLVHGEFERNDMVEYFGEQLAGFVFSKNGWVQSYGSRCVKPPIIYGDVYRPDPMTVYWSAYAQSLTQKPLKGMLTGPVTILQWSFVRNDQPRSETCRQIALAIRDEVTDLEKAGIKVIQIDEPAIREGLPLRKEDWPSYLQWAIQAFKISASGVKEETQIHTHMCYSEFNDIIAHIAAMDADVITIECSRSQMELLDAFAAFEYPNDIGPGVYDIHSPRVPTKDEMVQLMEKAKSVIPAEQLWVNPDCGLKTRGWHETMKALDEMVEAAKVLRQPVSQIIE